MKLNLGGGNDYEEGYVNCDISKEVKSDKIVDLEKKLPFKDNSVDEVLSSQIIEHLNNPENFVKELLGLSKSGAKINTMHFSAPVVFEDITYKRSYQSDTFNYFNIKYKNKHYPSLMNEKKEFFYVESKIHFRYIFKFLEYIVKINWDDQLTYERCFSGIFRADGQSYNLIVVKPKKEKRK